MGEMAKKIVKIDVEALIKTLNEAFAEEWLAYYQYWLGAKVAVGINRPAVVEEFNEHAGEELKHANWLADRIIQLGGIPEVDPNEWSKIAHCKYFIPKNFNVISLLKDNLESERCAVGRYQGICNLTYGKDFETFRIARKILSEEIEHEQEIEDFLADLDMTKNFTDM